jgi:flagellar protein FlaG
MSIEMMSAQSKMVVAPAAGVGGAGTAGAGTGGIPARVTPPPADNGVVQLFPREKKSGSEEATSSADRVSAMVEDLQASLEMLQKKNTHLNFSVHEETDRVMVRITDQETGDVIREIPSKEFLDLAAKLQEMVGLMFDMKF